MIETLAIALATVAMGIPAMHGDGARLKVGILLVARNCPFRNGQPQSLLLSSHTPTGPRPEPGNPHPLHAIPLTPSARSVAVSVVEGAGRNLVEGTRKADKRDDGKDADPIREAHGLHLRYCGERSPQSGREG
jgi:hypothetical protein